MMSKASGSLDQLKDRLEKNANVLDQFLPLIEEVDDMVGEAEYWNDDNMRLMEDIQVIGYLLGFRGFMHVNGLFHISVFCDISQSHLWQATRIC